MEIPRCTGAGWRGRPSPTHPRLPQAIPPRRPRTRGSCGRQGRLNSLRCAVEKCREPCKKNRHRAAPVGEIQARRIAVGKCLRWRAGQAETQIKNLLIMNLSKRTFEQVRRACSRRIQTERFDFEHIRVEEGADCEPWKQTCVDSERSPGLLSASGVSRSATGSRGSRAALELPVQDQAVGDAASRLRRSEVADRVREVLQGVLQGDLRSE